MLALSLSLSLYLSKVTIIDLALGRQEHLIFHRGAVDSINKVNWTQVITGHKVIWNVNHDQEGERGQSFLFFPFACIAVIA